MTETNDAFTLNGIPIDQEPSSRDSAEAEMADLLNDLRSIDEQLGRPFIEREGRRLNQYEYAEWRRKALSARRGIERRYRYLKSWMKHPASAPINPLDSYMPHESATGAARRLSKQIGALEAIAVSAAAFVKNPSEENLSALTRRVLDNAEKAGVLRALRGEGDQA